MDNHINDVQPNNEPIFFISMEEVPHSPLILLEILKDNDIPYMIKNTGVNGFLEIKYGTSKNSGDIYIPSSANKKAAELYHEFYGSDEIEESPQAELQKIIYTRSQKIIKILNGIAAWSFILTAIVVLLLIIFGGN